MSAPRFGLGFRTRYAEEIARAPSAVDWLEVVSDHHLGVGGPRRALLDRLCARHPIALHGLGLGIAGSDPLDERYLDGLCELVSRCDPVYVSDHLCWTALGGHQSHDLLPVAYTGEVLRHVAERVARVQDRIGRRLLVENATAYVGFRDGEMDEAEFLAELCRGTGCGVLLDVNNLFVNAQNLGGDPARALALLPESAVGYLHVAGHAVLPDVRIDTHAEPVPLPVWDLFAQAAQRFPSADVILERDDALPPWADLVAELDEARARHAAALAAPRRRTPARHGGARSAPRSGRGVPRKRPEGARSEPEAREDRTWSALQCAFWRQLVDPGAAEGPDPAERLDDRLPVRAARGMRVYRDAYIANLRAALATHFPALVCSLDAREWERLSRDYVRAHPPVGHGFVGLGAALADFVSDYRFSRSPEVPQALLAEIARLEQAQLEVQDAPDPEHRVKPADLVAVAPEDWDRARIAFTPAVRLLRTTHDVAPAVRAAERGEALPRPRAGPTAYLVTRGADGGVCTEKLGALDADLFEALLAGRTFGEACARICAASGAGEDHVAEQAARRLVAASAQGSIERVDVGASEARSEAKPSEVEKVASAGATPRARRRESPS